MFSADGERVAAGRTKRKSLRIFALTIVGILLGAAAFAIPLVGKDIGLAMILLSTMIGFGFSARLKCTRCDVDLSRKFPVRALILLWLAKDKCPNCNEEL